MKRFTLPEGSKRQQINGHVFKDGSLVVSDDAAKKLQKTFCRFYGCTLEDVEVQTPDDSGDDPDPNLEIDSTKNGQPSSDSGEEE